MRSLRVKKKKKKKKKKKRKKERKKLPEKLNDFVVFSAFISSSVNMKVMPSVYTISMETAGIDFKTLSNVERFENGTILGFQLSCMWTAKLHRFDTDTILAKNQFYSRKKKSKW